MDFDAGKAMGWIRDQAVKAGQTAGSAMSGMAERMGGAAPTQPAAEPAASPAPVAEPVVADKPSLRAAQVNPNMGPAGPGQWAKPGTSFGPDSASRINPPQPVEPIKNLVKPAYVAGENANFGGKVGAAGEIVAPTAEKAAPGMLSRIAGAGMRFLANPVLGAGMLMSHSANAGAAGDGPGAGTREATPQETEFYTKAAAGKNVGSTISDPGAGLRTPAQMSGMLTAAGKAPLSSAPVAQAPAAQQPAAPSLRPGIGTVRTGRGPTQTIGRANSFDGLGPMPANASPEEAANYLRATNVINQQRAAAAQQGGGGQGGDELAPLRRLGSQGVFGGLAALGGYGALDRMKSNAANMNLRSQQIQATRDMTMAEHARAQANTDREFGNKLQQQNQETTDKELDTMAAGTVGNSGLTDSATKAATATEKARLQEVAKYSTADTGKDLHQLSGQQRQQLYQAMKVRDNVMKNRDDLMDYFGNHQVDSKNAYSFLPEKVTPAARPGEKWVVHMKNGNQMALKDIGGGQFSLWGANKPVDADMMALIKPLIAKAK